MFFHKNSTFQKSSCVLTKHLNPSNYKNLFIQLICVSLHKKNTKDPPVFFTKTLHFKKSSCVLTKLLNPSNYKTCLYNFFVYLYTKKYQRPSCVFHKKHYISKNPHVFSQNTFFTNIYILLIDSVKNIYLTGSLLKYTSVTVQASQLGI